MSIRMSLLFIVLACFALPVLAQTDSGPTNVSINLLPREKLLIDTDRQFYLAGETIWFKLYDIDAQTRMPIELSRVAYVELLAQDGKPALQTKIELRQSEGTGTIALPLSLISGNYVLRAYTNWMKNFGNSLFEEKLITIVNTTRGLSKEVIASSSAQQEKVNEPGKNQSNRLILQPDSSSYSTRSKVQVAIRDGVNHNTNMRLSISVYRIDELEDLVPTNQSATGSLTRVVSTSDTFYLPEYEGHIIEANVIEPRSGRGIPNVLAYMSIPSNRFHFRNSVTDASGKALFVAKNYYGDGEVILQTNNLNDSTYRVEPVSPFSTLALKVKVPQLHIHQGFEKLLRERSIAMQVENSYELEKKEQYLLPEYKDTTAFYGTPDFSYNLDNYTRFTTMEEVMREYVEEVRVRKQADNFVYTVRNSPYKLFFETNPLVLLDGVPVFNVNRIMELDPLKVQRIELVTQRSYQGQTTYNGIVSYKSYNGDLAGYSLPSNAVVVKYPGLQLRKEFYSPDYSSITVNNRRIPDLRNLLYWQPEVNIIAGSQFPLTFYTSDLPGRYVIVASGIDAQGMPMESRQEFQVHN